MRARRVKQTEAQIKSPPEGALYFSPSGGGPSFSSDPVDLFYWPMVGTVTWLGSLLATFTDIRSRFRSARLFVT